MLRDNQGEVGNANSSAPRVKPEGMHRLGKRGSLGIGRKSPGRAKDRLREATRRNRGISLERMVADANCFIVGWVTYYRNARYRSSRLDLDGWLRRKVRCVRIKQCKSPSTLAAFVQKQGVRERPARQLASSGKGWCGCRTANRQNGPCLTSGSTPWGWLQWQAAILR